MFVLPVVPVHEIVDLRDVTITGVAGDELCRVPQLHLIEVGGVADDESAISIYRQEIEVAGHRSSVFDDRRVAGLAPACRGS